MQQTIFMTGATGHLGSETLPLLLEEGYRVFCLVRAKPGSSPQQRLDRITGGNKQAIAIQGDVCEPGCGIAEKDLPRLRGQISFILHCAASISFDDEKTALATNVDGVKNALEAAEELGVSDFRHISTAYVAGDAPSFNEDDLYCGQKFPNIYTQSKLTGEIMVRAWARHRHDRRYAVFRPTILIGREDGTTNAFDACYAYMYPFDRNAKACRARVAAGKALTNDIVVDKSTGRVHMPLAIRMSNTSTLNLIPVDWCARMLVDLLALTPSDITYHLAHPKPARVRDLLAIALDYLNIEGPIVVEDDDAYHQVRTEQSDLLSSLQDRVDNFHRLFRPYVTAEPVFNIEAPKRVLNSHYREPPPIDAVFVKRLLDYAVSTSWGQQTG